MFLFCFFCVVVFDVVVFVSFVVFFFFFFFKLEKYFYSFSSDKPKKKNVLKSSSEDGRARQLLLHPRHSSDSQSEKIQHASTLRPTNQHRHNNQTENLKKQRGEKKKTRQTRQRQ
eukprot:TRINITY_DN4335_c0_g1_i5.p1 TRINITY_DN4335_c0_g1~~TRINITY_DN4335_c0_g1_i5.p1  ORF type:complete len:115 (-),score=26.50 TRINITY_DN4335_c0_g1_i5:346-690(-)